MNPRRVLASHDLESCSFGRSDTPPPQRLPDISTAPEKGQQQLAGLRGQDAGHDLGPVVEPPIPYQVPHRSGRAGLRIVGAVDQPGNPRQYDRAGAHHARLQRDDKSQPVEPPRPANSGGRTQRQHLGMRARIGQDLALAVPVSVAVPIGIAANVCDVSVLSLQQQTGPTTCDATNTSTALSNAIARALAGV